MMTKLEAQILRNFDLHHLGVSSQSTILRLRKAYVSEVLKRYGRKVMRTRWRQGTEGMITAVDGFGRGED
jgi:hypothetical protein